jgi:hypothetical protein
VNSGWLWSQDEIDEMLRHVQPPTETAPEPAAEDLELPKKARTKSGEVIVLGRHRLLCGDSTSAKDVARVLGGATPRLMVTDPPYGVEYDAAWRNKVGLSNSAQTGKVANDRSRKLGGSVEPLSRRHRNTSGTLGSTRASSPDRWRLSGSSSARRSSGWKRRFAISRGAYHWRHEPCCYAVRKGSKASWVGGHKQDTVWADVVDQMSGEQTPEVFAAQITRESVYAFNASATTVWEMPHGAAAGGGHSTQKPIEAMARPMRKPQGGLGVRPVPRDGHDPDRCREGRTTVLRAGDRPSVLRRDRATWETMTGSKASRSAK